MKYIVELTNDCNLKCEMCPRNYIDMEIGYMSEDTWERFLSTIPMDSTILPFWRGESTLHPDFCERIKSLKGNEVVLATNGTNPDPIIEVGEYLCAVNVSIHNSDSYKGYLRIRDHVKEPTTVIASMVEGESTLVKPDRIYKRHSADGIWGKVDGENGPPSVICSRLNESVTAWNGKKGMCCYVWDIPASNLVCDTCDQWVSDRTL